MLTKVAIASGSIIGVILLGTALVILYKHAKEIPIVDFLKEVIITVLITSVIVFIISMWVLFTAVMNAVGTGVLIVILFCILIWVMIMDAH